MEEILEIMTATDPEKGDEMGIRLGIHLKIAGNETTCPISRVCKSYEALEIEVQGIRKNLERILGKAKEIFREPSSRERWDFGPDMEPEEIWSKLSDIADEDLFIDSFNSLDETKRKEVAEYVLTSCNVFSGKASIFSSRYNNETGFME